MRDRSSVLGAVLLATTACSGGHRSAAWGDSEPESAPPPESASAPVASASAASAAVPVCETPAFLNVKLGPGRALPEKKNVRLVRLLEGLSSNQKHLSDEDFAKMLDTAAPLDSCDPSIAEGQYAPDATANVDLADGTKLRLVVFALSRAELVWPDGTGVLFDYGDAAPWLPKDAQPFLRRDFLHDADCRAEHTRPHRIIYSPGPNSDAASTMKQLGMTCARLKASGDKSPNASAWCCA